MAGGGGIRKSKTIYYMRYQLHLPSSRTPDIGIKMPIKNLFKSEIFVVSFAADSKDCEGGASKNILRNSRIRRCCNRAEACAR